MTLLPPAAAARPVRAVHPCHPGRSRMAMPNSGGVSPDPAWTLPPPAPTACRSSAHSHAELVEEDRVAANVDETVDGPPAPGDTAMGKNSKPEREPFYAGGPYGCAFSSPHPRTARVLISAPIFDLYRQSLPRMSRQNAGHTSSSSSSPLFLSSCSCGSPSQCEFLLRVSNLTPDLRTANLIRSLDM